MKEKSKFLGTLTADEKAVDAGGNATKRDDYYEKKGEAINNIISLAWGGGCNKMPFCILQKKRYGKSFSGNFTCTLKCNFIMSK